MVQDYDSDFVSDTIADGETLELTVDCDDEDVSNVVLMIDDGTSGNQPSTYDLTTEIKRAEVDPTEFLFYAEETGVTARSWTDPAYSLKMRYTIANQSGGNATYRAVLVAYQGEA